MTEEYKHGFVDDYPYLVYCDDNKAVYTNESDVPYIEPSGTIIITENGEGIDVAQYAYADVNVSGGGSSDFTTATVTISKQSSVTDDCVVKCATFVDDEYSVGSFGEIFATETPTEHEVILYKGAAFGSFFHTDEGDDYITYTYTTSVSVTGDIEVDGFDFTITGDCTIVFTA